MNKSVTIVFGLMLAVLTIPCAIVIAPAGKEDPMFSMAIGFVLVALIGLAIATAGTLWKDKP